MKRVILKISGEALANQSGSGINPEYVGKIALEIKSLPLKIVTANLSTGIFKTLVKNSKLYSILSFLK